MSIFSYFEKMQNLLDAEVGDRNQICISFDGNRVTSCLEIGLSFIEIRSWWLCK